MERNYTKEIFEAIGEIKGELKGIHTQMKLQNGRHIKHDDRINDLETNVDKMKGITIAISFITATIISIIGITIAFFKK